MAHIPSVPKKAFLIHSLDAPQDDPEQYVKKAVMQTCPHPRAPEDIEKVPGLREAYEEAGLTFPDGVKLTMPDGSEWFIEDGILDGILQAVRENREYAGRE